MAKQYPIYVDQINNTYASGGKQWGIRDHAINRTMIGTSSRNSFDFVKTETSVSEDPATGRKHYSFRIDDELVRSAEYDPKTKIMKMTKYDAEGVGTTYYDNTPTKAVA
tara:strand:- start:325 stop:651 length:327 start_codon:yes stop_codon:yes gene_type:complete